MSRSLLLQCVFGKPEAVQVRLLMPCPARDCMNAFVHPILSMFPRICQIRPSGLVSQGPLAPCAVALGLQLTRAEASMWPARLSDSDGCIVLKGSDVAPSLQLEPFRLQ